MGLIATALNNARRKGVDLITRAGSMVTIDQALGASSYGGFDVGGSRTAQSMVQHAEQLRHFRGYPYAIIRTIANRIAGQPVRVARLRGKGKARPELKPHKDFVPRCLRHKIEDAEVLEAHAILEAFENPNPIMVRYAMMFTTVASLELTGKAFWWLRKVELDDGTIKHQIWPLPASWVEPQHEQEALYSSWSVRPPGIGEAVQLEGHEMAYFYYPDPSDPFGAMSPLQALAQAVTADEAIEESQRRAFINGCNPGLALVVGNPPTVAGVQGDRPQLSKEQRQQLISAVKQQYRGIMNNEEPLILDSFIQDVKKITNTNREMDFLNSSVLTQGRLAKGWGVSPMSMGEQGSNRAESAVADQHLADNVLNPRLEMLSEVMTAWLAPRFAPDEKLLIYLEPCHAKDIDWELQLEVAMVDRQTMSRNEWRQRHGLPPLIDGDNVLVQGQPVPVIRADQAPAMPPQPNPAAADQVNPHGRLLRPRRRFVVSLNRALGHSDYRALWLRHQGRAEDDVKQVLGRHLAALAGGGSLRGLGSDPVVVRGALEDLDVLGDLKSACADALHKAVHTGGNVEWQLRRPVKARRDKHMPARLRRAVNDHFDEFMAAPQWPVVLDGLVQRLTKAAGDADAYQGPDYADQAVRAALGPDARPFVDQTARTESNAVMNGGAQTLRDHLDAYRKAAGRVWVSVNDDLVRHTHQLADGQVVGVAEPFVVNGVPCLYPGDPRLPIGERANCRCSCQSLEDATGFG